MKLKPAGSTGGLFHWTGSNGQIATCGAAYFASALSCEATPIAL
jgi:hypothetical protein